MILSHDEILSEIKKGRIRIDPFSPDQVGPASIDLTLAKEFRVYKKLSRKVDVREGIDIDSITRLVVADSIVVKPQESLLGITEEKVTLPNDVCGRLEGRSRFARIGFQVHTTASFVQPGVSNRQVLEIANISPFTLVLYPGERVCQLILEKMGKKAYYSGRFSTQENL